MYLAMEDAFRGAERVRLDRIQVKTIPDVGGRKMERLLAERIRIERALRTWRRTAAAAIVATIAACVAETAFRFQEPVAALGWALAAASVLGAVVSLRRCAGWRSEARRNRTEIASLHGRYEIGIPEREIVLKREAFAWNRAASDLEARCRGDASLGGAMPREAADIALQDLLLRRRTLVAGIAALQARYRTRTGISWIHALEE